MIQIQTYQHGHSDVDLPRVRKVERVTQEEETGNQSLKVKESLLVNQRSHQKAP